MTTYMPKAPDDRFTSVLSRKLNSVYEDFYTAFKEAGYTVTKYAASILCIKRIGNKRSEIRVAIGATTIQIDHTIVLLRLGGQSVKSKRYNPTFANLDKVLAQVIELPVSMASVSQEPSLTAVTNTSVPVANFMRNEYEKGDGSQKAAA